MQTWIWEGMSWATSYESTDRECLDGGSSEEAAFSTGNIETRFGGSFWFESDSKDFSTGVSDTRKRRQRVVNQEIA